MTDFIISSDCYGNILTNRTFSLVYLVEITTKKAAIKKTSDFQKQRFYLIFVLIFYFGFWLLIIMLFSRVSFILKKLIMKFFYWKYKDCYHVK